MGILKLHSAYTPRKNPNRRISIANKVQLNIKFEEPKPQRYDGRRRSNSVDAATFARENRVHELRERRAPERFVPENFLIKAKEVRRQRRNSTTTAIEMQREAFKSSRSSFDMKQLEDRFLKIDKMTRCHSKNLPRKTPVETEKFVKSLFVDNMTGIIGESKMLLIKYEEMGGLIHLKPKAKRSVRTVDEGNDLIFFIVTGELNIILLDDEGQIGNQTVLLSPLDYIRLFSGVKYMLENRGNEPVIGYFHMSQH